MKMEYYVITTAITCVFLIFFSVYLQVTIPIIEPPPYVPKPEVKP